MNIAIRYDKGLGNAAVYARLLGPSGFWNFLNSAWDATETAATRAFMPELADTSTVTSWYQSQITPPAGGPYSIEYVDVATGDMIGNDISWDGANVTPPVVIAPPAPAGSLTAAAVFDKVNRILMDEQGVRWPEPELLVWLNMAQKEIATYKPNACTVNGNIPLVAGTKQTLPAAALSLVDVVRNMGAGTTPGRAITAVTRDVMDVAYPNWHAAKARAEVHHYIYDVRDPKVFYVFPPQPASTTQKVEVVYPVPPTPLTASSQAISVDEIYEPRLVDYILYRCYAKSDNNPADSAVSAGYANAFYSALGVKLQNEAQFSPQKRDAANAKGQQ